jgi:hypothetical protein
MSPFAHLRLFRRALPQHGNHCQTTDFLLLRALDRLAIDYAEEAQILKQRFLENETVYQVARRQNISVATMHRRQRGAIEKLVSVFTQDELAARTAHQALMRLRLELPTYSDLVAAEQPLQEIADLLMPGKPPWIVAITGIGGIGKTALADALLRQIIGEESWDAIGWVTARQHLLNLGGALKSAEQPALTTSALSEALLTQLFDVRERPALLTPEAMQTLLAHRLHASPHLIVIDNLETLVDVESLLATLRGWMNPSKFLLTTREAFFGEADVAFAPIRELAMADALRLVRQEAEGRNLSKVAAADDATLRPIVETVGGNPLALRLVVGQLHVHPLSEVLSDLRVAQGAQAESLYSYIYQRSWRHLNEVARQALLAMPLISAQGASLEQIVRISRMEPNALKAALSDLVAHNLVDRRGELDSARYSIHGLTRSFLHKQVVQWMS